METKPKSLKLVTNYIESCIIQSCFKLPFNAVYQASAQFSSVAQSCPTLCDPMDCSTPGLPAHHQLPEFTQAHVHRVGDAIQPSHPLSFLSPPAFSLSQPQVLFKWVSSSHQVAKVLKFYLQYIQELISFRMDWLDLLDDQGTLESLLQHHNSKASVLRSALFIVQLSHPYITTGKTIALTTQTFTGNIKQYKGRELRSTNYQL